MLGTLRSIIGFNPIGWISNTRSMIRLAANVAPPEPRYVGMLSCGIVVTPWLGTSVPWFSVVIGLLLARDGHQVTFVIDDFMFGRNRFRYRFVLSCLHLVMRQVGRSHKVLTMSQVVPNCVLDAGAAEQIRNFASLNTIWELRGEMKSNGRTALVELYEKQLQVAYSPIKTIINEHRFELLFMPGGVWGTTGIWAAKAQEAGVRIASFDNGGYGSVMISVNGLACHLQDIPAAFNLLKINGDVVTSTDFAVKQAQAEMFKRKSRSDKFKYQVAKSHQIDDLYNGSILIALNSSWDSAALGLHTIFKSNSDWIVETVKYLLEETDSSIVIRQHPAERLDFAKTTDDYRKLLLDNFGANPRLHFIAADDEINSYDLMARVKAVVVYTSTIGIEAAANFKPVITPSNSYYSDLGFVHKAHTRSEYENFLKAVSFEDLSPSESQQKDSLICYYLTQCCNFIWTPFNPEGFSIWSKISLTVLHERKEVKLIIRSLENNIPVAYCNHLIKLSLSQSSNDNSCQK